MLNKTRSKTEPWGTSLVTGRQLDLTPFTTTLRSAIQPVLCPAKNSLSSEGQFFIQQRRIKEDDLTLKNMV